MKSASVLNMSPSGRQVHFYSLTLYKLKLISWTWSLSEASAAGCRLLTPAQPAQQTLPSFHLIWGLDLIKDLQPAPSPSQVIWLSWWIFFILFFFCLRFLWLSHNSWAQQGWITTQWKTRVTSPVTEVQSYLLSDIHTDLSDQQSAAPACRSKTGIVSVQKSHKVTFSCCHWLVPVNKQLLHILSQMSYNYRIESLLFNDNTKTWFFSPFGGSLTVWICM